MMAMAILLFQAAVSAQRMQVAAGAQGTQMMVCEQKNRGYQ